MGINKGIDLEVSLPAEAEASVITQTAALREEDLPQGVFDDEALVKD